MIQQTSILAYTSIGPDLTERQKQVYEAIAQIQPCSNIDIQDYLGWSINSITPRVKELREKEMVFHVGYKEEQSGRKAMTWGCFVL